MKKTISTITEPLISESRHPEIESSQKKNKTDFLYTKLKESEMRYRRLFETAQDGILILDYGTGNIVEANPFIIKMIGYSLNEIVGKKLWEIGLFSNKGQSELAFDKLKKDKYIRFDDMPIHGKNGKVTEVEYVSNVYLVNDNKVIQCNIRDISERKLAEHKQELTASILSILNSQDNWQQSIKEILAEIKDYTKMEAVGIRLKENDDYPFYETLGFRDEYIKWEKYLCYREETDVIIRDGQGKPFLRDISGDVIEVRTNASLPYFSKGGSFYTNSTSLFLANTMDISEEMQSETINRSNAEGYESVAMIPLYSGSEIIGLLQLNDKRTDMLSLEMIRFFEKTGNTIGIAFNRIQNEVKIRENEQNLRNQNTSYLSLNKEYSILTKDLTESINHIQDINDELVTSKVKAEESDKLKSAFLANMSHEIRTPMNAIMGFSEFLLEPGLSQEKLENYVQIINASCLQLLSVISDIIDISKIEAGQVTINSVMVNVNKLMNELLVTYKKLVEYKALQLIYSFDCPEDIIEIRTDETGLNRFFVTY